MLGSTAGKFAPLGLTSEMERYPLGQNPWFCLGRQSELLDIQIRTQKLGACSSALPFLLGTCLACK